MENLFRILILIAMIRNGLTFVQVHKIFEERLRRRHLNAERRFLEDFELYSGRHPVVFDTNFPDFDSSVEVPSRNLLQSFFIYYFEQQEIVLADRMSKLTTNAGWLSCDHTFAVTNNIGYERSQDKQWIKQFENLFCVLNEKGQVLTWKLCVLKVLMMLNVPYKDYTKGFPVKENWLESFLSIIAATGVINYKLCLDQISR